MLSEHCITKPTISSSITQYFAISVTSLEHSADTHITDTVHGFMVDKRPAISYNRWKTEPFWHNGTESGVKRKFVGDYVQQRANTHLVHNSESNWKKTSYMMSLRRMMWSFWTTLDVNAWKPVAVWSSRQVHSFKGLQYEKWLASELRHVHDLRQTSQWLQSEFELLKHENAGYFWGTQH